MNIVPAYQGYMRMAYFAALRGVYDFEASYEAYRAMAACDVDKLIVMTTSLRKSLKVKPSQVKFHKDEKSPKSYKSAKANYEKAYQAWLDAGNGRTTKKSYLVKITGEQGTKKKDSTLVAHYSDKRPRKVVSPFGEVDNTEVF